MVAIAEPVSVAGESKVI